VRRTRKALRDVSRIPGPGVVTGASDDDPSGIATYAITGAQTGYSLLWTNLLLIPLGSAIQEMCARIGVVTGSGLASSLRSHYPRWSLLSLVSLLLVANMVNIGADIVAVAEGMELLTGLKSEAIALPIGIAIAATEVLVPYRVFARYLRVLTLVLFAYVLDALVVGPNWSKALRLTFVPSIELNARFLATVVANFGTTITPYLFFWQTSDEIADMHRRHIRTGDAAELRRLRFDVDAGMILANVAAWFIVLTAAATLYPAGIHNIGTAREAAEALRPLAGDEAASLFAVGLIGMGLLGIPVLAGSSAFALAEVFDWREGLERKPAEAPQFYVVIVLGTLVGVLVVLSGLGAIRALFVAAVLNGIIAPVLISAIMIVGNDRRLLGAHRNGPVSNLLGLITMVVMTAAALAMMLTFVLG
jgi:NRAMP (natural resistance-associated macrophage protein)-like metal ion transporter